MDLYHYFDKRSGPFKSLTALPPDEADRVHDQIKSERPDSFCAVRDEEYLERRRKCEAVVRERFIAAGGLADTDTPHYMVVGECPWLLSWYEQGDYIRIPVEEFDTGKLSFTYGDMMPVLSPGARGGRDLHDRVFTYDEILDVIDEYGLPQDWNADGTHGYERYIEVHVWTDEPVMTYVKQRERIERYEKIMDEAAQMIAKAEGETDAAKMSGDRYAVETPDDAEHLRDLIAQLEAYYGSEEWKRDYVDDERGLFPPDMKRGVLSEDGIYNLLEAYRELNIDQ